MLYYVHHRTILILQSRVSMSLESNYKSDQCSNPSTFSAFANPCLGRRRAIQWRYQTQFIPFWHSRMDLRGFAPSPPSRFFPTCLLTFLPALSSFWSLSLNLFLFCLCRPCCIFNLSKDQKHIKAMAAIFQYFPTPSSRFKPSASFCHGIRVQHNAASFHPASVGFWNFSKELLVGLGSGPTVE